MKSVFGFTDEPHWTTESNRISQLKMPSATLGTVRPKKCNNDICFSDVRKIPSRPLLQPGIIQFETGGAHSVPAGNDVMIAGLDAPADYFHLFCS